MRLVASSSRLVAMATAEKKPEIASSPPSPPKLGRSVRVAVVGAGSSGLAAARELSLAGHQVTVFERGRRLGGLWASSGLEAEGEQGAEDGDGADGGGGAETSSSSRKAPRVHSSLYPSLRTNLPRILMGFASYPFTKEAMELTEAERKKGGARRSGSGSGGEGEEDREEDARAPLETLDFETYPGHGLVLRYLQSYSDEFELERFVRYGRELVRASPVFSARGDGGGGNSGDDGEREVLPWPRWRVVTRATVPAGETGDAFLPFDYSSISSSSSPDDEGLSEEVFDALVCCSGHFAVPRLPPSALAAIEAKKEKSPLAFPGLILHAHSYRGPGIGPLARVLLRREGEEGGGGEKPKEEAAAAAVVVAVVGAGPSGEDIAREVSGLADRVLLCSASTWEDVPLPRGIKNNIEPRPFVVKLDAEGVHFGEGRDEGGGGGRSDDGGGGGERDGGDDASPPPPPPPPPPERVDAVIYATGYLYDFPELSGTVAVEDNEVLQAAAAGGRAGAGGGAGGEGEGEEEERPHLHRHSHQPLWEHLFCPRFSVGLSLLGLPFKVVPFPLVEAQARLVARALALVPGSERGGEEGGGKGNGAPAAAFPSTPEKMAAAALEAALERAELGVARRHTHRMGCPSHFEYIDRLVDAAEALGGIGGGGGGGGRGKNDGGDGDDDEQQANGGASPSPPPPLSPSPSEENWRLAPWRKAMYMRASEARRRDADSYRDTADLGEENVRQAEAEASAWLALRKKRTRTEGEE